MATLGACIRERRVALGLTQEELAERVGEGVRQSEVSRLERGLIGLPRRSTLERFAAALDLPIGELLARSGWAGADAALAPSDPPALESSRPAPLDIARLQAALERSHALYGQLERTASRLESVLVVRRPAERP